jgi:hypothetical protein
MLADERLSLAKAIAEKDIVGIGQLYGPVPRGKLTDCEDRHSQLESRIALTDQ